MQIVESTAWGVRSARITLDHPTLKRRVVLFPMIHVGEPAFYARVFEDAFAHDVALVEGVKSPVTTWITRSYRWVAGAKRINLHIQPRSPPAATVRANMVHADLSRKEFEKLWGDVPLWQRAFVYVFAPLIGLNRRWFGSRESLAKNMSLDDAMSQKELLDWSPETALLNRAILDGRDERLLACLADQLAEPSAQTSSIAIVYGAQHMRAVLRDLTDTRGYACVASEWMTVFTLD